MSQLQNKLPGLEFIQNRQQPKATGSEASFQQESQPMIGMVGALASCGYRRPETKLGSGGAGGGGK